MDQCAKYFRPIAKSLIKDPLFVCRRDQLVFKEKLHLIISREQFIKAEEGRFQRQHLVTSQIIKFCQIKLVHWAALMLSSTRRRLSSSVTTRPNNLLAACVTISAASESNSFLTLSFSWSLSRR